MKEDREEKRIDALCPECGHAFAVYMDRIISDHHEDHLPVDCPACGCRECRIGGRT